MELEGCGEGPVDNGHGEGVSAEEENYAIPLFSRIRLKALPNIFYNQTLPTTNPKHISPTFPSHHLSNELRPSKKHSNKSSALNRPIRTRDKYR